MTGESEIPGAEVFALCMLAAATIWSPVVAGVYGGLGEPVPADVLVLDYLAWGCAAWAWLWAYSRRHRLSLPTDLGWWLMALWWAIVPYYVIRGSGRRAAFPLLAFVALWVVGRVLGAAVHLLLAEK